MTHNIKAIVAEFRKKYHLTDVSENVFRDIFEQQGYTVIYFNKIINDENITKIINNLDLHSLIESNKGFTFANEKYRLVFVNDDLSCEEKTMVLSHEMGHVFLEHTSAKAIMGQDVKQEHEANEFAHYLLHPGEWEKFKLWTAKRKKTFIILGVCALILALGVTAFAVISKQKTYYGEYYVTSTGSKYHKKDCIFVKDKTDARRLTKDEFENGDYESCKTCLP